MSIQAYQRAAQRAEDPRSAEYRLLGQVTRALMDLGPLDPTKLAERADVLDWNRKVWSVFATDCAAEGNGLSQELRAGIISLSLFVNKHTSQVLRGKGDVDVLIDINRQVMQGLSAGHEQAAAAG